MIAASDYGSYPATEAQKRFLRDLATEADGEVDEEWLARLTRREASKEIEKYGGQGTIL